MGRHHPGAPQNSKYKYIKNSVVGTQLEFTHVQCPGSVAAPQGAGGYSNLFFDGGVRPEV